MVVTTLVPVIHKESTTLQLKLNEKKPMPPPSGTYIDPRVELSKNCDLWRTQSSFSSSFLLQLHPAQQEKNE